LQTNNKKLFATSTCGEWNILLSFATAHLFQMQLISLSCTDHIVELGVLLDVLTQENGPCDYYVTIFNAQRTDAAKKPEYTTAQQGMQKLIKRINDVTNLALVSNALESQVNFHFLSH
jgi:hypothetical protein